MLRFKHTWMAATLGLTTLTFSCAQNASQDGNVPAAETELASAHIVYYSIIG